MKQLFFDPLKQWGEMEQIQKEIYSRQGIVEIEGCSLAQKLHMVYTLPYIKKDIKCRLVITTDEVRARELIDDYRLYSQRVFYYPAKDLIFYQADIKGNLLSKERMEALCSVYEEEETTIITTIDALMEHVAPPDKLKDNILKIREGDDIDEGVLAKRLVQLGYEKVARVEDAGQYAVRGGIIDIYSITEENPFRIELWGSEVDSLRVFDCESQRSLEKRKEISIFPAGDLILSKDEKLAGLVKIEEDVKKTAKDFRDSFQTEEAHRLTQLISELKESVEYDLSVPLDGYLPYFYKQPYSVLDFFEPENTMIFLDEPVRLVEKAKAVFEEYINNMQQRARKGYALESQAELLYPCEQVLAKIENYSACAVCTISQKIAEYKPFKKYHLTSRAVNSYNNSFEALLKDLGRYRKNKFKVLLLCPSRTRAKRLAQDITDSGISAFYSEDENRVLQPCEIMVTYGRCSKGFEYPLMGFVVISEGDIFGQIRRKKHKKKKYEGTNISSFNELQIGDYVVHENHGLGIYQGIEQIEVNNIVKDYMKISYRDGGNLYVVATGLDQIQKYASADAKAPKLNKLGGPEWTKTKTRVKGAVAEIAHDLVELYAKRQQDKGFVYDADTVWQQEFEEMFPYEETEDQLQAIADTKSDMMSHKIMDRLICGDVGYGKTEIAIRAAFKAVQEGKQVAFLVPTTILAQQHYNNIVQRMKDFPVTVELLCRFRTAGEIKKSLQNLKKGQADIVIGTHRLLSKDVEFKDLGLLVIDEEQRFGVSHKERIKKMRENVDVLTLTATPIPRTLHMSLVGIRDMSVLEEPPQDRMPIQTFVMEYNEELVREAIVREISRGGQVYYVYNRVNTIADVTAALRELIPDAQIEYAHGQMKEEQLERLMVDFINGEIDVLVSTTIIETGLDIPNVNTIIVHDSDRMGLSQLYQLRGRVGRSNRTAYAFLMYKRDKLLREEAEKRLAAIREFTDLGSGFKIAMKDLEIRGAGSILGERQHGHMAAVGYDLYCKMLNEAVRKEKGIKGELQFTTTVEADMDAYIPDSYIANESVKLDTYKRIAGIENAEEAEDMIEELTDRFGKVPACVQNLVKISLLREMAQKVYIEEVSARHSKITLAFAKKAAIDPGELPGLLMSYGGRLSFRNGEKPALIYSCDKNEQADLISLTEKILKDMTVLI